MVRAVLLILFAAAAGAVAWGSLSNLWAEYQDSPTSTYLLIGLPALALCLASLVAAAASWRQR
jgi:hypothetical protein